jgi:hypothetical protein
MDYENIISLFLLFVFCGVVNRELIQYFLTSYCTTRSFLRNKITVELPARLPDRFAEYTPHLM